GGQRIETSGQRGSRYLCDWRGPSLDVCPRAGTWPQCSLWRALRDGDLWRKSAGCAFGKKVQAPLEFSRPSNRPVNGLSDRALKLGAKTIPTIPDFQILQLRLHLGAIPLDFWLLARSERSSVW